MYLRYRDGHLCFGRDSKALSQCLGNYSKPTYFYSREILRHRLQEYQKAFLNQMHIHYAFKANGHDELLKTVKGEKCGLDVVSGGELQLGLKAGFRGSDIVFSGVAKTKEEIEFALAQNIFQINVESPSELRRIAGVAKSQKRLAPVSFRMNPDVNPQTHPYITTGFRENKFGMDESFLPELLQILKDHQEHLQLVGLAMHIGSQVFSVDVFREAIQKTKIIFTDLLKTHSTLERFDVGGGLGINYELETYESDTQLCQEYAKAVLEEFKGFPAKIHGEPGRWLVGRAGVLVAQVQYIKKTPFKNFLILDTGMHHLLRPALYSAFHHIRSLKEGAATTKYDVVGPICESTDYLAKDRMLPEFAEGDFVAIADAGAYGFSMASFYNCHEFPHQVLVD